jgi:hypothetical protein
MTIHVAIAPSPFVTRILAISEQGQRLLQARLSRAPHDPHALPLLLRAVARWQDRPVRAVLFADTEPDGSVHPAAATMYSVGGNPRVLLLRRPPLPLLFDRSERLVRNRGRFAQLRQELYVEALLS